jgi:hypothetical protein
MKVKITYTVDYEDVPQLVNDLLARCRNKLISSSEFKFDLLQLENAALEISKLQDDLALVSSQLSDCVNLWQGYVQTKQQVNSLPEMEDTDIVITE